MHFTLADLVTDITQNSAESGADTVELEVRETRSPGAEFRFITKDNGKGMSGADIDRAVDPFVTDGIKHPGRRVGLGIPFLIQTALQSGGGWKISSNRDGVCALRSSDAGGGGNAAGGDAAGSGGVSGSGRKTGTSVEAWFDLANVDTPPVGDVSGLFRTVMLFSGPGEIILRRFRKGGSDPELDYEVKKSDLTGALGDLEDVSSLALLGKYLRSLEGE
ncbi:MAG: ATP-binding protein [Treponema sp.]|jgi:hypothetical protein|nr:ATP-binding protein [Treponema sp.]